MGAVLVSVQAARSWKMTLPVDSKFWSSLQREIENPVGDAVVQNNDDSSSWGAPLVRPLVSDTKG